MASTHVTVAGDTLSLEAAQSCIGRYCGAPAGRWEPDRTRPVDPGTPAPIFRAHGYRSFDCVPAGPGRTLDPIDVLVGAGLGDGMDQDAVDAVLGLRPALDEALLALPDPAPVLWEMSSAELFGKGGMATTNGELWRPWALLMNVRGVGMRTTHAVLHHKLPTVYPLLDRRTVGHFTKRSQAWQQTHHDLVEQAEAWTLLEDWHRETIVPRSGPGAVPLNRLRLHSVILDVRTT
ncbi:DUF6308 family protein [Euzebya rosea]|uniref:DUF6308 family protein n=1 Tax=Euzebya rosea TaxID=2052804 RepID=UPI0014729CB3|nr:DUF6308 family protein [Euzebya rosea]